MLRNSIQHQLYHQQKGKEEFSKLLKLLRVGMYTLLTFNIMEMFRQYYFPNFEFGLSFMFWGICLMLCYWWMPKKEEYDIWKEKNFIS